jgi:cysteine desulfurase/selenocysteine lyase
MTAEVLPLSRRTEREAPFNPWQVRRDFPILHQKVGRKTLVYLDSAAMSQKPRVVLDAIRRFYQLDCANVHRGVHTLSERATDAYEAARAKIQRFINARHPGEIVFVRGATEGINLVAGSYGRTHVRAGDEIVVTMMEHHSNIVPWQILCEEKGARLRVAPVSDTGELRLDKFEQLLNPRTRFVSVVHVSNALGTVNPIRRVVEMAHGWNVPVLIDGAQAAPHLGVDVKELDCDFYVFSGHKLYGPTGIGVLYGKEKFLEAMPPYQGGGEMISTVSFEKTTYKRPPFKFEAGTPNIAGAIGLGTAVDYVEGLGRSAVAAYEEQLMAYATRALLDIPGVRLIGTAPDKVSVVSFVLDGVHPHDIGTILDDEGIAIRAGHHCAQPLMERFRVPATARASFALYNVTEEIDALVSALHRVRDLLG